MNRLAGGKAKDVLSHVGKVSFAPVVEGTRVLHCFTVARMFQTRHQISPILTEEKGSRATRIPIEQIGTGDKQHILC